MTRSLTAFILGLVIASLAHPLNAAPQTSTDNFALNAADEAAFRKGRYTETEHHLREAVRVAEETRQATALGNLAQFLSRRGQYREAEDLFVRSLRIAQDRPADPRIRPILLLNLAALYSQTNRPDRAEPLLDEALILCRKYFGPRSPQVSSVLKSLGIVYAMTKRIKPAEGRLKEALALAESRRDSRPEDLASVLTSLAGIYSLQHRWHRAEALLTRALDILENSYGPRHTGVSDALANLGAHHVLRGELARAESAFRRALDIRLLVYGPEHIDAANTSSALAAVLTAQGKYEEAHRLFVSSLPVQERFLGQDAPKFALALEQFSALLRQLDDTPQAEILEARARYIRAGLAYTVSADRLGR
jgi:tetratricopeptide (TPR) repeat protein